jgi:hypothetical protein
MKDIFIALAIGALAGTIDIIPMIFQKINKYSIVAVFCQWVFLGLVIPFVDWDIQVWAKGLILGLLGMTPIMILALFRNKKAAPSILLFGALLGMVVAVVADFFIH